MCRNIVIGIYGVHDRNNLDIPQMVHDHNITISINGEIAHFIQLERITGKKRDNKLHNEIDGIIRNLKLIDHDIELVFVDNVVGRAFISTSGNIRFEASLSQSPQPFLEEGKAWWFDREINAFALNHELAHVFSAVPFFGMFKENSLMIHFDGGASLSNFSAWHFKNGQIKRLEYHWDLKFLTSLYNANALTFGIIGSKLIDQNSVPGKLMGFAAYGKYRKEIEDWLIENNWFKDCWNKRSYIFKKAEVTFGIKLKSLNQKDPFIQDIAATIQEIFNREIVSKLNDLQRQTKAEYLYYTGGSALNIVANTKIIEQGIFKDVFIPPCTEDSGLSLGAVAFYNFQNGIETELVSSYLNNSGIDNDHFSFTNNTIKATAQLLVDGKTVGICNGYGESGPRALGNRSILALANSKQIAKKVSMDIKQREWYRPVAPILLEKNVKLATGLNEIHHLSKFMLLDFEILPEYRNELEGVTHIDGSARIQTIFTKSDNPFIFELLKYLDENHGMKALINTSFNGKGQPILHTQEDALRTAKSIGLNAVVMDGSLKVIQ